MGDAKNMQGNEDGDRNEKDRERARARSSADSLRPSNASLLMRVHDCLRCRLTARGSAAGLREPPQVHLSRLCQEDSTRFGTAEAGQLRALLGSVMANVETARNPDRRVPSPRASREAA